MYSGATTAGRVRSDGFACDLHADGRERILGIAEGRLDADAAVALGEGVLHAARATCELVVLDLRQVDRVAPEAVGVILDMRRRLLRAGTELVVTPGAAVRAAIAWQDASLLETA